MTFSPLSNGKEQRAGKQRGLIGSMCPLSSRCLPCQSVCLSTRLLFVGWVFIFTLHNPSAYLLAVCLPVFHFAWSVLLVKPELSRQPHFYGILKCFWYLCSEMSQPTYSILQGFKDFKWLESHPSHNATREMLISNLFCNVITTLYIEPESSNRWCSPLSNRTAAVLKAQGKITEYWFDFLFSVKS